MFYAGLGRGARAAVDQSVKDPGYPPGRTMPNRTILLIDFDPASIDRATSSLQHAGYRVEVAHDGVEGLDAYERVKPDLVLIEAMLPKKHGFEVCREIKRTEDGESTPVLITTAESKGSRFVNDAMKIYGCDDFFEKPIEEEELLSACRRFLNDEVDDDEPVGLESLSEDEIVAQLDAVLDERQDASSDPPDRVPAAGEQGPPLTQRDLEEEDLLSFCDRVFSGEPAECEPLEQVDRGETTSEPQADDDPPQNPSMADDIKSELDALLGDESAPAAAPPSTEPVDAAPRKSDAEIDREAAPPDAEPRPELNEAASATGPATEAAPADDEVVPPPDETVAAATESSAPAVETITAGEESDASAAEELAAGSAPAVGDERADEKVTAVGREAGELDETDGEEPATASAITAVDEPVTSQPAVSEELELPSRPGVEVAASEPESDRQSSKRAWILGAVALLIVVGAAVTVFVSMRGGGPRGTPATAASKAISGSLPQPVVPRTVLGTDPGHAADAVFEGNLAGLAGGPVGVPEVGPSAASTGPSIHTTTKTPTADRAQSANPDTSAPGPAASRDQAAERGVRTSREPPVTDSPGVATAGAAGAVLHDAESLASPGTTGPAIETPPAQSEDVDVDRSGDSESADPLVRTPPGPAPLSAATALEPEQPELQRAKTRRGALIDIAEVDSEPVPISRPDPEYPTVSRRMRHEGRVVLNLLIDENGRVVDIDVISGVPRTRLDRAASDAARRWIYRPATKDGVEVKVWKTAEFIFKL
jgi:TonB family protein